MNKGDVKVTVAKTLYPDGSLTVRAYFPYPGLAVHREIPYPANSVEAIRSVTWRRWSITHIDSGLRINDNNRTFKRLRDACLACKMIADILPWTADKDTIIKCSSHRKTLVRLIIDYASEGHTETEIAQLLLEQELKS